MHDILSGAKKAEAEADLLPPKEVDASSSSISAVFIGKRTEHLATVLRPRCKPAIWNDTERDKLLSFFTTFTLHPFILFQFVNELGREEDISNVAFGNKCP